MDNIDGVRVDGLSLLKVLANDLKDSPVSEETADAERQTKDAWCGSRSGDWWLASVASMATVETVASMASVAWLPPVASMASMDWWRRVASSGVDRSSNDDGAACFVVFGSTKNQQCE